MILWLFACQQDAGVVVGIGGTRLHPPTTMTVYPSGTDPERADIGVVAPVIPNECVPVFRAAAVSACPTPSVSAMAWKVSELPVGGIIALFDRSVCSPVVRLTEELLHKHSTARGFRIASTEGSDHTEVTSYFGDYDTTTDIRLVCGSAMCALVVTPGAGVFSDDAWRDEWLSAVGEL
jgi:hypothetical protein